MANGGLVIKMELRTNLQHRVILSAAKDDTVRRSSN